MRIWSAISCILLLVGYSSSHPQSSEAGPGGQASQKASQAAFAFAKTVAPEGTPEFTAAFRSAVAMASGYAVSQDAVRAGSLPLSGRGLLDLDSRYRNHFSLGAQVRIWGGERVTAGMFLDTVAIVGNGHLCTGTVVAANAVLTAAHCFCGGVTDQVYVGENINAPTDKSAVDHGVAMMKCTEDLKTGDVAVLFLKKTLAVTPRAFASATLIGSATTARAVGFGATENPISEPIGIKRRVDVPIASSACSGTVSTSGGSVTDANFYGCAPGAELVAGAPSLDKDSCNGDSGGPLFVQSQNGNLYLAATTSRATGPPGLRPCGDGGIYVRSDDKVVQWLQKNGVNVTVGPSQ